MFSPAVKAFGLTVAAVVVGGLIALQLNEHFLSGMMPKKKGSEAPPPAAGK